MRRLLASLLTVFPFLACAQGSADYFSDKPYTINLGVIQALDSKPLRISNFYPEPDKDKTKGLRIISTGLPFPIVHQIITISRSGPALDPISKALDGKNDILAKDLVQCKYADICLKYTQRFDEQGKPHHVSSNLLFVKDGNFYHFASINYAAFTMGLNTWPAKPVDANADAMLKMLLDSTTFKESLSN